MNVQDAKALTITEGEVRTIHDKDDKLLWGCLAYDTKYAGDTIQDGTPTPDAPVAIQIVTGTQTVTITDGVISDNYTVNLGSIELCKIGDYQDYIYKSGSDWYVHKEITKIVLDGSSDETWAVQNSGTANFFYRYRYITGYITSGSYSINNLATVGDINSSNTKVGYSIMNSDGELRVRYGTQMQTADWRTFLSSNNMIIYYALATPTDTQITDNTLITQLEAVNELVTRYGYNATISGNIPLILTQTTLT